MKRKLLNRFNPLKSCVLALTICAVALTFMFAFFKPLSAFATEQEPTSAVVNELWKSDTKSISKDNFVSLLQMVTGDSETSLANIEKLQEDATSKLNAAQMREYSVGKTAGEDISVKLGGLDWTATYLSTDKERNIILTLWLTGSPQTPFEGRSNMEGEFYGFADGYMLSDWSANWQATEKSDDLYLVSMYSTSYIRSVTLNSGEGYATSAQDYKSYQQSSDSVFALFTMEEGGLTQYLVKPHEVDWQESGQSGRNLYHLKYDSPCSNWSIHADEKFSDNKQFFKEKEYYSSWANDYLWLPSVMETGYSESAGGIWKLSDSQRAITSDTIFAGVEIGSAQQQSVEGNNYTWFRESSAESNGSVAMLGPEGTSKSYFGGPGFQAIIVRPALHLNLTKIISYFKYTVENGPFVAQSETILPQDVDLFVDEINTKAEMQEKLGKAFNKNVKKVYEVSLQRGGDTDYTIDNVKIFFAESLVGDLNVYVLSGHSLKKLTQTEGFYVINGTKAIIVLAEESDNTTLILGLSVGGGVIVVSSAGLATWFVLRRKRKESGQEEMQRLKENK